MRRYKDIIKLNDEDVKSLLSGKSIKKTLTSGRGRKYGAYLVLEVKEKYINLKVKDLIKR